MTITKELWYLSGPITGYPDHNTEEFATQASFLRHNGYRIINPCALPHLPSWHANLKRDIKRLMNCKGVFVLKGWQASKGAVVTRRVGGSNPPLGVDWFRVGGGFRSVPIRHLMEALL